jgi:hypothetical protein
MVKVHFTLSCTVAASFCLHTGGILVSQDTESVLCVLVVDVHDVIFIYKEFLKYFICTGLIF